MEPGFREHAVAFPCGDDVLVGIISQPVAPHARGMLIVVGGPQYRVGSHRQFVHLARHMAASGTAVMRFDYRGMGDSSGELRSFEHVQEDMRSAIDCFFASVPTLREVVLWGLCDAACAATFYAPGDPRVRGMALLNPWVRTPEGEARAYLRHYYVQRLFSGEFWQRLLGGKIGPLAASRDFARQMRRAVSAPDAGRSEVRDPHAVADRSDPRALPVRMAECLAQFRGHVLVILSGNDLTAQEFVDVASRSAKWRKLLRDNRVTRRDLPPANHTFASEEWRERVQSWTREWIVSW